MGLIFVIINIIIRPAQQCTVSTYAIYGAKPHSKCKWLVEFAGGENGSVH